jgi:hypothetical protein
MNVWRSVAVNATRGVADEALQKRCWFGIGPEVGDPDEFVNQFFEASLREFLEHPDNALTPLQISTGRKLQRSIEEFTASTPSILKPQDVIDDPRWRDVRAAAAEFLASLGENLEP